VGNRRGQDSGANSPLGGFLASRPPRVLAHRGLALDAPENTLQAFAAAVAIGATHIETDVHVSADGDAIIAHDPNLSRVAGRDVRVDQLTTGELARVPLGAGQSFATLAEALDGFPETYFNIDIKTEGAVEPTVRAITKLAATSRVLIASFSARRRIAVVRQLPGVATSLSMNLGPQAILGARVGARPLLRRLLRGVDAVQLPFRLRGVDVLTARAVAGFHAAGVEVHAWTVNEAEDMERLLERGVDGIVTDRVDVAMPVLERYRV